MIISFITAIRLEVETIDNDIKCKDSYIKRPGEEGPVISKENHFTSRVKI